MKLRNKKTGEIWENAKIATHSCGDKDSISVCQNAFAGQGRTYDSLVELNEEWEDYKPAEPLIKDEKNRKAVRAWAEANKVTKVYVYGIGDGKEYIELYAKDDGVTDGRIRISLPIQDGVRIGEEYTIEELRGEDGQSTGEAKQYDTRLPQRERFERMKQQLRYWTERNKIDQIQTYVHTEPDGRRGVQFIDKANAGDNRLTIIGWPTIGLVDGATYTPDELLITGEAGKE